MTISLQEAIKSGDPKKVEQAFASGAQVVNDAEDDFNNSLADALYCRSSPEIVKLLLDNGAQVVNDAEQDFDNSLTNALDRKSSPEIIDHLLLYGADQNVINDEGKSLSDVASVLGQAARDKGKNSLLVNLDPGILQKIADCSVKKGFLNQDQRDQVIQRKMEKPSTSIVSSEASSLEVSSIERNNR